MIRNRIIPAFVIAGMVGVAACERQEETQIETVPTTEAPATDPAPIAEPAPMTDPAMDPTVDPMADDTLPQQDWDADTPPQDDAL